VREGSRVAVGVAPALAQGPQGFSVEEHTPLSSGVRRARRTPGFA
jgi:hypothetical protein